MSCDGFTEIIKAYAVAVRGWTICAWCEKASDGDVAKGVGIVTQKDILGVLVDPAEDLVDVKVREVMTSPAVGVSPDFGIPTCVQMMRMIGVRRVPVLENNKLVGIISFSDVFDHAVGQLL